MMTPLNAGAWRPRQLLTREPEPPAAPVLANGCLLQHNIDNRQHLAWPANGGIPHRLVLPSCSGLPAEAAWLPILHGLYLSLTWRTF